MTGLWAQAALGALVSPLLFAGLSHAADVRGFAGTIRSHRLVGGRPAAALARAVTVVELFAVPVVTVVVAVRPSLVPPTAAALAVLFALFAGYLVLAYARTGRDRRVECGYGGLGTRLHRWSWLRPAVPAVALAAAAVVAGTAVPVSLGARLLAVTAGWSLATAGLCLGLLRRMNAVAAARHDFRLLVGE